VLYRPSELVSAGVFYNFNPTFDVGGRAMGVEPSQFRVKVSVPDRAGIGVAVRPFDELVLVADLLRIRYSQQAGRDFHTLLRFPELNAQDFFFEDAWELHAGLEYVILTRQTPIALRAGFFTNPSHPLQYRGPADTIQGMDASEVFPLSDGETQLAYTLGLGVVLYDQLRFDAAYLDTERYDEVTASLIVQL
jgi:hypothetical protein